MAPVPSKRKGAYQNTTVAFSEDDNLFIHELIVAFPITFLYNILGQRLVLFGEADGFSRVKAKSALYAGGFSQLM